MRQRVEYLKSQREKVSDELKNLPLQVWDSAANFILFKPLETVECLVMTFGKRL